VSSSVPGFGSVGVSNIVLSGAHYWKRFQFPSKSSRRVLTGNAPRSSI
jgi:hypothetical protein